MTGAGQLIPTTNLYPKLSKYQLVPKAAHTQGLGPWVRHDMGMSWFWVRFGIGYQTARYKLTENQHDCISHIAFKQCNGQQCVKTLQS